MNLRNLCFVAVLWGGFWVVAPLINRDLLFAFMNALTVSIAMGVIVAYISGVKDTFFRSDLSAGHYLVFGILCAWAGSMGRQAWAWGWRYLGKPDWMEDHLLFAFFTFMAFTGGVLHLTAPGAVEGVVPRRNWMYVGLVMAAAMVITLVTASLWNIRSLW